MTALLDVEGLSASYGRAQVLFDISLQVCSPARSWR